MKREFYIAGVQFHESAIVANKLKEGITLVMRPEPSNKFDPNAIALLYKAIGSDVDNETMIGYVPAKFSPEVSAALEVSDNIICTLSEVNLSAKTWERFKVVIGEDE